ETTTMSRILWKHPNPEGTRMFRLIKHLNHVAGLELKTFDDLHAYSLAHRNAFWLHLFRFLGFVYTGTPARAVDESLPISAVPSWFPGVSVNFAENMLFSAGPVSHDAPSCLAGDKGTRAKEDAKIAVTEVREGGSVVRHVSWAELRQRAGEMAAALCAKGVRKGDRVVVVGANSLHTLLVYLGTTWLGALFSSASTDMGIEAIVQRVTLVDPKFVFYDDAAVYNGKTIDLRPKITAVVQAIQRNPDACKSFLSLVVIPRFLVPKPVDHIPHTTPLAEFLSRPTAPPPFERTSFSDPSVVYYSSGTTGIPKAIVHTVGGILINIYKERTLHEYRDESSTALQFTTTGWIMYLSAVSPLLFGARAVLYDGSPLYPDRKRLVTLTSQLHVTSLGISPRFLSELARHGVRPRDFVDLSRLEVVTSTGMVLPEDLFEWFYDHAFPAHTHLANISGGTDIAGCFALQNPLKPLYVGGIQGPSLGVAIDFYDSAVAAVESPAGAVPVGSPVPVGTPGELVAPLAFPNMPCFLWADGPRDPATGYPTTRPGPVYTATYFARYRDVWAHGDLCSVSAATGAVVFLGRADGVLNPSGVRFGSAEIYAVMERSFASVVAESLCVGRRRRGDADEQVMLFLVLQKGVEFSPELVRNVKREIGRQLSKRHVPAFVFPAPEIPVTVNMKKVEVPVKRIVSGERVQASGTLLNPESLQYFYQFARVEEEKGAKL
ncbi:hypothetical protein TD95_002191, partial [Thielaviopsis punctulata]